MKKLIYGVVLLVGVNIMAAPGDVEINEENDLSTLNSPAQALKAENLATAAQDAITTADIDVQTAQTAVDNATTEEELAVAEEKLADAQERFSKLSGVTEESINDMRTSGMEWGEITHELGIHPSVLGLGNVKRAQKEFNSRTRDIKSFTNNSTSKRDKGSKSLDVADKVNNANSKSKDKSNNSNSSSRGKSGKD